MSTISAGTTTTTALVSTGDTTGNLILATGATPTTALTLNSTTQAATFAGAVTAPSVTTTGSTGSVNSINTFGFKNRIINGGMTIDQRNAGASVTPTTGQYLVDRWSALLTQASKYTAQQNAGSVTLPAGYINYLGITSSSAYSVAAGDFFAIVQKIEGLNIADLAWGTANAKTVTLSFQVYSSLTGTFGGNLKNSAGNRSYPFTYSIPVANTWTSISVTIAGDTSGTWLTTNGIGIEVNIGLGVGTTYSGTAGAWSANNYVSATGAVSVVGTSGATFYITGVQLEVGSQATSFDFRSYGTELALCQRYFLAFKGSDAANNYTRIAIGPCSGSTQGFGMRYLGVAMRAAPTSVTYSGSVAVYDGISLLAITALSLDGAGTYNTVYFAWTVASGATSTHYYDLLINNSSPSYVFLTAEL
jgi:hypothetical protein